MLEFVGFPKIPRYSRDCCITEKIDGSNGQILFEETDSFETFDGIAVVGYKEGVNLRVYAGSRTRWLTLHNDNFGFANWVLSNCNELSKLGPGRHFGEWWGQGIQRGYGLKEKRFSLFNVKKWMPLYKDMIGGLSEEFPKCCHVVPIIASGDFSTDLVEQGLRVLRDYGSHASPGFMDPEGIVIYHVAGNLLFKKTFRNDEKGKGE
jgi:hypothetical protein